MGKNTEACIERMVERVAHQYYLEHQEEITPGDVITNLPEKRIEEVCVVKPKKQDKKIAGLVAKLYKALQGK